MTFEELKSALLVQNGLLEIEPGKLPFSNWDTFLMEGFAEGKLSLTSALITEDPGLEKLDFTGILAQWGEQLAVAGTISLLGGEPLITLEGAFANGWKLEDSFSGLGSTGLGQLVYSNAKLEWDSSLNPGTWLRFSSDFNLPEDWGFLTWLLIGNGPFQLSGPVVYREKHPVLRLSTPAFWNVSLGGYLNSGLSMEGMLQPSISTAGKFYGMVGQLTFRGSIFLAADGSNPSLEIPVRIPFNPQSRVLKASLELSQDLDVSFAGIANWLGGINIGDSLPGFFQPFTSLQLSALEFAVGLGKRRLESVQAIISSPEKWVIIENILEMDQLSLLAIVYLPGTEGTSTYLNFSGLINLGGLLLDVHAQSPDLYVRGQLAENNAGTLSDFAGSSLPAGLDLPGDWVLEELTLEARPGSGSYRAQMEIDGFWEILPGLSLGEISLVAVHEDAATRVELDGFMDLWGFQLEMSAEYDGGEETWIFEGFGKLAASSEGGNLNDVVNLIGANFGLTLDLPGFLGAWIPGRMEFEYIPKTGEFQARVQASMETGGRQLQLELKFLFNTQSKESLMMLVVADELGVDLPLGTMVSELVPGVNQGALDGLNLTARSFVLARSKTATGEARYLLGMGLGLDFDLRSLPLLGDHLPPEAELVVRNVQAFWTKGLWDQSQMENLNQALPFQVDSLPSKGLKNGFNFRLDMQVAQERQAMEFPLPSSAPQPTSNPPESAASDPVATNAAPVDAPASDTKWLSLNKKVGPLNLHRLGLRFSGGQLWVMGDFELRLGKLGIGFKELGMGSALSSFDPKVSLGGMDITYNSGAMTVQGAFSRQDLQVNGETISQYAGAALIKTKAATISALGAYATVEGQPSIMLYAHLDRDLGGPPFFFIEGLSAGFGIHRRLNLPAVDQLGQHSLMQGLVPGQANGISPQVNDPQTLLAQLSRLEQDVTISIGDYFLAAGVKFTSFKMIRSFALLTLRFGEHTEMDLMGRSAVAVPFGASPGSALAYGEFLLRANYRPESGVLKVDGRLTPNSYILSRDCRLEGGFAWYAWFNGEHEGDFVLTMGGYHPSFRRPAHYPAVPRMKFNWQVNSNLTVKGDGYFALTPNLLMAGGSLNVSFKSGRIEAWFKASADFLMSWQPFHYHARLSVEIGVRYTFKVNLLFTSFYKTISVSIGADLELWGPEFSGRARVKLWIVSFTISFGANAPKSPPPLAWSEFKEAFLPAENELLRFAPGEGLLPAEESSSLRFSVDNFSIGFQTKVPAKTLTRGSETIGTPDLGLNADFGLGPMCEGGNCPNFQSGFVLKLKRLLGNGTEVEVELGTESHVQFIPRGSSFPSAIWGKGEPDLNGTSLLKNILSGGEIRSLVQMSQGQMAGITPAGMAYDLGCVDDGFAWKDAGGYEDEGERTTPEELSETQADFTVLAEALGLSATAYPSNWLSVSPQAGHIL